MREKFREGVSFNSILLIKHFTWHTFTQDTLIYKKVVEICRADVIILKFDGGEAVNRNFLRDILTLHTSL